MDIKLSSGIKTLRFCDDDGTELFSFRINPTDTNLAERCEKVSEYFRERTVNDTTTIASAAALNRDLETQINYLIGMPDGETIFKPPLTACTVLESGDLLAAFVLDQVIAVVEPIMKERAKKAANKAAAYMKKYERV